MKKIIYILICFLLAIFGLFYGYKNITYIIRDTSFIFLNSDMSESDKKKKDYGIAYLYSRVIKERTNEDARIMIPPADNLFGEISNTLFFRYFVYPRFVVNGNFQISSFDGFDYVVVYKYKNIDLTENIWPNQSIESKKFYSFDANGQVIENSGNYIPESFNGIGGLIEI